MRDAFIKTIHEEGKKNSQIFILIADIGAFLLRDFKKDFPERLVNIGIAEANMVGIAAGLALDGKIPFVYAIASFLTSRCIDQIRINVSFENLNVKIVGVGSGISYSTSGPTHHSLTDVAIMRSFPNMVVISPCDSFQMRETVKAIVQYCGPVYLRILLDDAQISHSQNFSFQIGKAEQLQDGEITVISNGPIIKNVLKASEGLSCRIINMHTIKPLDREIILKAAIETKAIITIEEHSIIGGLGSAVAEVLAEEGLGIPFRRIGFEDTFCLDYGKKDYLYEKYNFSVFKIKEILKKIATWNSQTLKKKI